jgi:hypothetical protein
MVIPVEFATHTELAEGLRTLIKELEKRTDLREPINMVIAGGMAIHLYTAARVTTDVGNTDYLRMNLRDVLATADRLTHEACP